MFNISRIHKAITTLVILTLVFSAVGPTATAAQGPGPVKQQVNAQTGKVNFIGPENGKVLPAAQALGLSRRPENPGLALAKKYGPEFGLQNAERDLSEIKSKRTEDGRVTVRYQQEYKGIPVLGGELIVNTNDNGDLYSINGEISTNLTLQTDPTIDAAQASQTALQALAKWHQQTPQDFQTTEPELWIFDESLLGSGNRPAELVWRMEVTPKDSGMPVRELVLVNAERGSISLHFNQIDTAWHGEPQPEIGQVSNATAMIGGTWYVATTGNDTNNCTAPATPCATINGAIGKAAIGDTIKVAIGTYTGTGIEVALINKSVTLSGGWDLGFTTQSGMSTIDGQNARRGISVDWSTVTLEYFIVKNGFLRQSSGGGINNQGGTLTLNNSAVSGNTTEKGGGINNNYGTLTLNNSTVSGNTAHADYGGGIFTGGGIYNYSGTLTLNNSTVSGNTAYPSYYGYTEGGGIYNYSGTLTLKNSTVSNNSASYGGGIFVNHGVATLHNSIVARNLATTSGPNCHGTIESSGYNLLGNNAGCTFTATTGDLVGTSASPINPRLTPLQNNGGPTLTHALLPGSPAINAGNPGTPGSGGNTCLATDQRGVSRLDDTICDIGALENFVGRSDTVLLKTYTADNTTNVWKSLLCTRNQFPCTGGTDPHADAAHTYTAGTYELYFNHHARNSIDNDGMAILSTVHFYQGYTNAFWNGLQAVYGDGYGFALADDVVAHELTHGVTQHESYLYYWYQSGAINESFSDLWGEYYDQTNGMGNDDDSKKWLIGEDVTGLSAIRSMKNPPAYGDPDKMTSSLYRKSLNDNGGVHHNSGVNNKAVYLMVDGGTFNNKTVTALGWEKVGAIYYEVQTNLLSPGSNYSDLYYALQLACTSLTGQYGIEAADCQEVKDALDAVQMNSQPRSGFNPVASLCPSGMATSPSLTVFEDNLESGLGNWAIQTSVSNAWSFEEGFAASDTHMLYGDDYRRYNDSSVTLAADVYIPEGKTFLHFKHAFLFDYFIYQGTPYYFDGGRFEYSTNSGSSWKDAKPLFSGGKNYGPTLYPYSGNPLGGKSAFVGDSHGYVSSRYNLSSLAGQTVNFRWRLGTDQSVAFLGWFVDDVQVYTCVPVPAIPTLQAPANNILLTNYTATLLNWSDTLSGLDHYQIQVATDNTFSSLLYDADTGQVSEYQLPADLSPNTTYFWRVQSFNELDATQGWSAVRSFRAAILPPALTAPTDLAVLTIRRPTFDWNAVAGATSYKLVISKKPNLSDPIKNLTVNASEYLPTADLPANTLLYWRVRSQGANGPSDWSETFEFTTGKPPSVPSLLKPANNALVKDYTPLFDWSNATVPSGTGFLRYELQVDDNNDFSSPEVQESPADSTFTPASDLTPNTLYFWRVRAVNDVGGVEHISSWSAVRTFRAAIVPPTLLLPAEGSTESTRQPVFDWADVDGATSYTIQIALGPNFGTQLWLSTNKNASTFALTRNLPRNTLIYWRVRANGPNGPSGWSEPATFTTPQ